MTSTKQDADVKPTLTPSTHHRRGAICLGRFTELAAPVTEHTHDEAMPSAGVVPCEDTNSTVTTNVPKPSAASGSVGFLSGGRRRGAISVESREELMTSVPRIVEGLDTLFGASRSEAGGAGLVPGEKEKGRDT